MTREEALKRGWHTARTPEAIADELLAVERETEARVAEQSADIVSRTADRCADIARERATRKDKGSASQVAALNIADAIRREFPKKEAAR